MGDSGIVAVFGQFFVEEEAQKFEYIARDFASRRIADSSDTQDRVDAKRPFTPSFSSPPRASTMAATPLSWTLRVVSSPVMTSLAMSWVKAMRLESSTFISGLSRFCWI
jgi:hypothetical protein